jgi:hypothetical protein
MTRSVSARSGASAAEAIVALLLGLLVVHLALETLARVRSAGVRLSARADALVALRLSRHVVRRELELARPTVDWGVDADSIYLRAFRGEGIVCSRDTTGAELLVSYSGDRAPNPAKDSVLLLSFDGVEAARALVGTGKGSGCDLGDGGSALTLRLDLPATSDPLLARVFERGSYHLSGYALRYRRGDSGRQPLTPEVWSASSGWRPGAASLGVELAPRDTAAGRPWQGFLAWTAAP